MFNYIKSIIINKKIMEFAFVACLGAFLGSYIGYNLIGDGSLIKVSSWDAIIGVGIGIAMAWKQSSYMHNSENRKQDIFKIGFRSALGGAAGGAGLVLVKGQIDGSFGHVIAWSIEGLIMGLILAPVFPNLPRIPAALAGLTAGFFGGLIGPYLSVIVGSAIGIALADSLKGLFLGAMLTVSEKVQAISAGYLLVNWGPKEQASISLGKEPIRIGSRRGCQIYLKPEKEGTPDIIAEFTLKDGNIYLTENVNRKTMTLSDGSKINFGKIQIEVKAGAKPKKI